MARDEWKQKWFAEYSKYLDTPEWAAKRLRVLERDNYICQAQMEGCKGRATSAHHLDYLIWDDTPLFHLISVCGSCHEKITRASRSKKARRQDLADLWRERMKQKPSSFGTEKSEASS